MPACLVLLALFLPGCVAGAAATYFGNATFDYAEWRLRVEDMDCDDLQVTYAQTAPSQSLIVNRYTDWLTTRGMMEERADALDSLLPPPPDALDADPA